MDWKTENSKGVKSSQNSLQIPSKTPEGLFCGYRQSNFKIYIDRQKN